MTSFAGLCMHELGYFPHLNRTWTPQMVAAVEALLAAQSQFSNRLTGEAIGVNGATHMIIRWTPPSQIWRPYVIANIVQYMNVYTYYYLRYGIRVPDNVPVIENTTTGALYPMSTLDNMTSFAGLCMIEFGCFPILNRTWTPQMVAAVEALLAAQSQFSNRLTGEAIGINGETQMVIRWVSPSHIYRPYVVANIVHYMNVYTYYYLQYGIRVPENLPIIEDRITGALYPMSILDNMISFAGLCMIELGYFPYLTRSWTPQTVAAVEALLAAQNQFSHRLTGEAIGINGATQMVIRWAPPTCVWRLYSFANVVQFMNVHTYYYLQYGIRVPDNLPVIEDIITGALYPMSTLDVPL